MFRLHQRHPGQRALAMYVRLTETGFVYRHLKFFILAPQHFRPMAAVRINRTSVIKDYAFHICQFIHLL